MMIIYALYTEQSVGRLFAAGIIPGLITAVVYVVIIVLRVKMNPRLAPALKEDDHRITFKERSIEAFQIWPVVVIAVVVFGGIYSGLTTPTEAAATGSVITLLFGFLLRSIRKSDVIIKSMRDSANTTSMLFLTLIGAMFYSRILALTNLPNEMSMFLINWNVPAPVILFGVLMIMFTLGMIMVPVGIYALTLPIVFPLLVKLGYDPIWFGVICLKLTEIGSITPPVGINVYVMKGVIPKDQNISLEHIFKGIWPFLIADTIVLVILVAIPQLSIWLPNLIFG
jgi:tripartite ATP-independent transporter DctM subunit